MTWRRKLRRTEVGYRYPTKSRSFVLFSSSSALVGQVEPVLQHVLQPNLLGLVAIQVGVRGQIDVAARAR